MKFQENKKLEGIVQAIKGMYFPGRISGSASFLLPDFTGADLSDFLFSGCAISWQHYFTLYIIFYVEMCVYFRSSLLTLLRITYVFSQTSVSSPSPCAGLFPLTLRRSLASAAQIAFWSSSCLPQTPPSNAALKRRPHRPTTWGRVKAYNGMRAATRELRAESCELSDEG